MLFPFALITGAFLPPTVTSMIEVSVPKLLPVIITRVLAPPSLGVKSVISTGLPGS